MYRDRGPRTCLPLQKLLDHRARRAGDSRTLAAVTRTRRTSRGRRLARHAVREAVISSPALTPTRRRTRAAPPHISTVHGSTARRARRAPAAVRADASFLRSSPRPPVDSSRRRSRRGLLGEVLDVWNRWRMRSTCAQAKRISPPRTRRATAPPAVARRATSAGFHERIARMYSAFIHAPSGQPLPRVLLAEVEDGVRAVDAFERELPRQLFERQQLDAVLGRPTQKSEELRKAAGTKPRRGRSSGRPPRRACASRACLVGREDERQVREVGTSAPTPGR